MRLFDIVTGTTTLQVSGERVPPAVAQAGVADPSVVRLRARENHVLTPEEITELVNSYSGGASVCALAQHFSVHRETVAHHLTRAGVAKRPVFKMTESGLTTAKRLYAQGWSTQRIGRELRLSQSTVYKALVRAGVRMRPPVV